MYRIPLQSEKIKGWPRPQSFCSTHSPPRQSSLLLAVLKKASLDIYNLFYFIITYSLQLVRQACPSKYLALKEGRKKMGKIDLCQTTVWRKSDMKHLSFSLMQRKQESKLLCPAEAKTEGKIWSLCNSSGSHSSASGERVMEEPQLLTETHCHPWPEAKPDWKQARMHHPWYFIWSSISAPWTHFTLLVLPSCSFHYHSLYSEGCSKVPKWSSPPWPFRIAQTFVLFSNECNLQHVPTALCFSRRWTRGREANNIT